LSDTHLTLDLLHDDLTTLAGRQGVFVTLGEVLLRDMPADNERLERTRQVWVALAGTEFNLAVMLSRLGVPCTFVTRAPANPYGWLLRNVAREQGLNVDHFVWAGPAEPMGRLLYELGRTPRPGVAWYQRMYSAASRLGPGMVDWPAALKETRLLHAAGISFGLSAHSGYERNYVLECFQEALAARPAGCRVGLDFNYRSTLWSPEQCKATLTPLVAGHVDILVTTVEDLTRFYGLRCEAPGADGRLSDGALQGLLQQAIADFQLQIVAVTLRYADSYEAHRWESAALDAAGHFARSRAVRPMVLWDRLGGGDAWTAGFYYGLLTEPDPARALQKGILVGDAATRLKQTLMFDLPIVSRQDVQALLEADEAGGATRTVR